MVWGDGMNRNVCCVFGHRKIEDSEELRERVRRVMRRLVLDEGVDTVLFGSKSAFDELCHAVVSELKCEFPQLKRVYVRAEFPFITEQYAAHLLQFYEETYFPAGIENAGRAVYIERNFEMIRQSRYCLVYFDADYRPRKGKSGTAIAYERAVRQGCTVLNLHRDCGMIPQEVK